MVGYAENAARRVPGLSDVHHLVKTALGPLAARVQLHQGYVEVAPAGSFDAASCLMTLHFTTEAERYRTLCEIRAPLKPGGTHARSWLLWHQYLLCRLGLSRLGSARVSVSKGLCIQMHEGSNYAERGLTADGQTGLDALGFAVDGLVCLLPSVNGP